MGVAGDPRRKIIREQVGAVHLDEPADQRQGLVDRLVLLVHGDIDELRCQPGQLALDLEQGFKLFLRLLAGSDVHHHHHRKLLALAPDHLDRDEPVNQPAVLAPNLDFQVGEATVLQHFLSHRLLALRMHQKIGVAGGPAEYFFPGIPEGLEQCVVDLHETPVRQGQQGDHTGIAVKQALEALLRLLLRGQVLADGEHAFNAVPFAMPDPGFHRYPRAVPPYQRQRAILPLAAHHGGKNLRRFGELVRRMKLEHVLADQLCDRIAKQTVRGLIDELDISVAAAHQHKIRQGLEKRAEVGLALAERLLRQFPVGDVPVGADQPHGPPRGILLRLGKALNVADRPIGPPDPEFDVEIHFAPQHHLDSFIGPLPVIRMHGGLPGFIRAAESLPGNAIEPEHLVVPDQPVVGHIQVPGSHATRAGGQGQPLRRLPEFGLGLFESGDVAADAEHADEFSIGSPIGGFERVQQHFPTVWVGDPFLIVPPLAGLEHAQVILAEPDGNLVLKEIKIGFANDLGLGDAEKIDERRIATKIDALQILVENEIRDAVQQRTDQAGLQRIGGGFLIWLFHGIDRGIPVSPGSGRPSAPDAQPHRPVARLIVIPKNAGSMQAKLDSAPEKMSARCLTPSPQCRRRPVRSN